MISLYTLLIILFVATFHIVDGSCTNDQSIDQTICHLNSNDVRLKLLEAIDQSQVTNTGVQSLIDRLYREDVDGSVLSQLKNDDLAEFVDNQSISTSSIDQLLQIRDDLVRIKRSHLPDGSIESSIDVSDIFNALPSATKESLHSIGELISSLPATRVPARSYTGQWSSDAARRTMTSLFTQSSNQRPRVVVVLGEDFPSEMSSVIYALAPDVIILQVIDQSHSRTIGNLPKPIQSKIASYRSSIDQSSNKLIKKRGANSNFVISLDHNSFNHAICLLMHASVSPDAIYLAHSMFPWSKPAVNYCLFQSNAFVFGSEQLPKPMLHQFSQGVDRRVYLDSPMFVVSDERLPELSCNDGYGHRSINQSIPLVTLYMILKNEAGGIENTMLSVLPYIDQLVVLDTGSTDGTPQLISELLNNHPNVNGRIYQGSFIDFSTTRNEALYLASNQPIEQAFFHTNSSRGPLQNSVFLLMLNGDDELINGPSLRTFLSVRINQCGPTEEMMLMSVDYEGRKLAWSERLMRSSNHRQPNWPYRPDVNHKIHLSIHHPNHTFVNQTNLALHRDFSSSYWHYEGLTHEVYTHPLFASGKLGDYAMTYAGRPTDVAPLEVDDLESIGHLISDPFFDDMALSFNIWHTYVRDTKDKLRVRAAHDARLLLSQLETSPDDPRTMFYLSHSYDVMDDFHNAYHWHMKRSENLVSTFKRSEHSENNEPLHGDHEECTCLMRLGKISAFRLPEEFGWSVAEPWFQLARTLCPDQVESRFYLAQHAFESGELKKALTIAAEADKLIKNKRGLMHVLEAETVHQMMPQLIQHLRTVSKEAKQKKQQINKQDL